MTEANSEQGQEVVTLVAAMSSAKETAIAKARELFPELPHRVALSFQRPEDGGPVAVGPDDGHEKGYGEMMAATFGSMSDDFIASAIKRIINAIGGEDGEINQGMNAALATIAAIGPKNEYEASLAVQVVTSHAASQLMLSKMVAAGSMQAAQTFGNLATKFQRTELAARDALQKHRTGGVQTVKHVHVNEGGQAIVADSVTYGGASNGK